MSALDEDKNSLIDPEAEVKKLQDLVKKLEQQNQILRNKQNDSLISTEKLSENGDVKIKTTFKQSNDNERGNLTNVSLDNVALLDVDNSTAEDDDNWLFKSPKKLSPAQKSKSPYKWMREEFESPEVEVSKRSLLHRLDEMARVSRSSSCGTLGSLGSPSRSFNVASEMSRSHTSPGSVAAVAAGGSPAVKQPFSSPSESSSTQGGGDIISHNTESEDSHTTSSSSAASSNHYAAASSSPFTTNNGVVPSIRQPLASSLGRFKNNCGDVLFPVHFYLLFLVGPCFIK